MMFRGLKRDFSPVTPRLQPKDSTLSFPPDHREARVRTAALASMESSWATASMVKSSPSLLGVSTRTRSWGVFSLNSPPVWDEPASVRAGGKVPTRARRNWSAVSRSAAEGGRPRARIHASSMLEAFSASLRARWSGQSPLTRRSACVGVVVLWRSAVLEKPAGASRARRISVWLLRFFIV